jgi:hypothetical protein
MSLTTSVSNVSPSGLDVLAGAVAAACASAADSVGEHAEAVREARRTESLESVLELLSPRAVYVDLGAATRSLSSPSGLRLGGGSKKLAGVRASLATGSRPQARQPAASPTTSTQPASRRTAARAPASAAALPAAPQAPVDLVWTDAALACGAFRAMGCEVQGDRRRFRVRRNGHELLTATAGEAGRYQVRLGSEAGAVALDLANRRYLQEVLEAHAGQTGGTAERRQDGSIVLRAAGQSRVRGTQSPSAAAGTVEVDFAGFKGTACNTALAEIAREAGLRPTRGVRGKLGLVRGGLLEAGTGRG